MRNVSLEKAITITIALFQVKRGFQMHFYKIIFLSLSLITGS